MKEELDEILKRKWEEQSFPMDETHRAKMIELLNVNKRRRVFPFWWFGGLLLVAALSGYFLFQERGSPQHQNSPIRKGTLENSAATMDGITNSEVKSNVIEESNLSKVTSEPDTNISNDLNQNSKSAATTFSKAITNPSTGKSTLAISATGQSQPSGKYSNADAQPGSFATQGATPTMPSNVQTYRVDDDAVHSYGIVSMPVAVIVESDLDQEGVQLSATLPMEAPRASVEILMIDPLAMDGILFSDALLMNEIKPSISNRKPFYVFGEAGVGIVLASKPDFTSGWKLKTGAGLGYNLSPKIQLTWAAGYMMQQGGFDFERTSTVSSPGFGVRSSFNSLTPEKLHFVYTKIGAQYHLRRHIIEAHGGIQWLYGAQGHIVIQTNDQIEGPKEFSTYGWVKTDGLSKVLWTGGVSYGYQITPRFNVMAGTDIYFSSFTIENPALAAEGYYWKGSLSSFHPFLTLNYLIHGNL